MPKFNFNLDIDTDQGTVKVNGDLDLKFKADPEELRNFLLGLGILSKYPGTDDLCFEWFAGTDLEGENFEEIENEMYDVEGWGVEDLDSRYYVFRLG